MRTSTSDSIATGLLVLFSLLTVVESQYQQGLVRRIQLGGYHAADVNDPFVESAVQFTAQSLSLAPYPDISFLTDDPDMKLVVVSAEKQVVAGMNVRLTLQIVNGNGCMGAFDVEIYNHFGDMTVTKWGEQRACEDVNIPLSQLESLMLEGTTVLDGTVEANSTETPDVEAYGNMGEGGDNDAVEETEDEEGTDNA